MSKTSLQIVVFIFEITILFYKYVVPGHKSLHPQTRDVNKGWFCTHTTIIITLVNKDFCRMRKDVCFRCIFGR